MHDLKFAGRIPLGSYIVSVFSTKREGEQKYLKGITVGVNELEEVKERAPQSSEVGLETGMRKVLGLVEGKTCFVVG